MLVSDSRKDSVWGGPHVDLLSKLECIPSCCQAVGSNADREALDQKISNGRASDFAKLFKEFLYTFSLKP